MGTSPLWVARTASRRGSSQLHREGVAVDEADVMRPLSLRARSTRRWSFVRAAGVVRTRQGPPHGPRRPRAASCSLLAAARTPTARTAPTTNHDVECHDGSQGVNDVNEVGPSEQGRRRPGARGARSGRAGERRRV